MTEFPETLTITINITEDDIKNGIADSCEECPAAIAVYRALTDTDPELYCELIPYVGDGYVHLFQGEDILFSTPQGPDVGHFVENFDDTRYVTPFTVELTFRREY